MPSHACYCRRPVRSNAQVVSVATPATNTPAMYVTGLDSESVECPSPAPSATFASHACSASSGHVTSCLLCACARACKRQRIQPVAHAHRCDELVRSRVSIVTTAHSGAADQSARGNVA